jgi:hypothetical protein
MELISPGRLGGTDIKRASAALQFCVRAELPPNFDQTEHETYDSANVSISAIGPIH